MQNACQPKPLLFQQNQRPFRQNPLHFANFSQYGENWTPVRINEKSPLLFNLLLEVDELLLELSLYDESTWLLLLRENVNKLPRQNVKFEYSWIFLFFK